MNHSPQSQPTVKSVSPPDSTPSAFASVPNASSTLFDAEPQKSNVKVNRQSPSSQEENGTFVTVSVSAFSTGGSVGRTVGRAYTTNSSSATTADIAKTLELLTVIISTASLGAVSAQ